ncbi:MAG: hypothetical protein QG568_302 [Patescibacteria group bacterium]|nr:hypothetical protein [Patescibacteria group bacterium]
MEGFRYKTEEELQNQIEETTESLGVDISRPSLGLEIVKLPLEEIKAKYPERYEAYLKILRAEKNNQEIDAVELKEMREWIGSLNNLDEYIANHSATREDLDARNKRQLTVFEDIRNHLEKGEKEGYVKLPTGVGKTVLFSRITEALGLKTLIVVPSKILIGQTGEKLEEFTNVEFGKYYQGEKNLEENVTVITYLSLVKAVKEGRVNPADYEVLILDEAHKALGEETSKVIDQFEGVKLGFTATPKYSKDKHVRDLLEHEMHSMGIVEAAKEGLISRFKSYIAYTDTDLSNVEVKNREKYDENELERAIDQEGRNQSAVELYKQEFNGKLAIAYCGGVTHATHVAELFNKSGISAEIISGDTPDDKSPNGKEAILERFRTGETKVLCNARILIEGFDEPKASTCLNLQPTLSLVDAEQRAGRVLRLDSEDPDKWAYIVDFIDRDPRVAPRTFAEIAEASEVDGEYAVAFDMEHTGDIAEGEREDKDRIPDVDIKGLRVVVDAKEVLTISQGFIKEREDIEKDTREHFTITPEELKSFCDIYHIQTSSDYQSFATNDENRILMEDKPKDRIGLIRFLVYRGLSINTFFGKEKREKITITVEELKEFCILHGINSGSEYEDFAKSEENINVIKGKPTGQASLKQYLRHHNQTIGEFFVGKKREKMTITVDELKEFCILHGINSGSEYEDFFKKEETASYNMPKTKKTLTHFLGRFNRTLNQFFGKEKRFFESMTISIEDLKQFCIENNITSPSDYNLFSQRQENEVLLENKPKNRDSLKNFLARFDKTLSEFFDKEKRKFITLEELRKTVQQLKISSKGEYRRYTTDNPDRSWPNNPDQSSRNSGWISSDDLFGR